jgi:SAM-dependent methyltransferase
MKVRDSGMPSQDYWETLFDVPGVLDAFGFGAETGDVAELGCGYGTFTIPLARRIRGCVHTFDLESEMVGNTVQRAASAGVGNIRASVRDVLVEGFGIAPGSCDACLLFNILHAEEPLALLRAAREVVRPEGLVAVIHWRSDIPTPRGPALAIRPRPEQIAAWAKEVGGLRVDEPSLTLEPWHFGLKLWRNQ